MNYKELFKDRVVIISGVGRSGTTILGKLAGSFENVVYLFEPAILKLMRITDRSQEERIRGIIFEDYLLPVIQGRVNENSADWSWYGHYFTEPELIARRQTLSRRVDAIALIKSKNIKFIIKTNEAQFDFPLLKQIFPGCKIINIIRNGLECVSSMIGRGWFTDEWCNDALWLPPVRFKGWDNASQIDRAAFVWCSLAVANLKVSDVRVEYDVIRKLPESVLNMLGKLLNSAPTKLTFDHKRAIKGHTGNDYQNINLSDITNNDIRQIFVSKMKELGYAL